MQSQYTHIGITSDSPQELHLIIVVEAPDSPVGTAGSIVGFSQVLICSQVNPLVPKATL